MEPKKPELKIVSGEEAEQPLEPRQRPEPVAPDWIMPDFRLEPKATTSYDRFIVKTMARLKETSKPKLLDTLFIACFCLAVEDTPRSRGARRAIAQAMGWKDTNYVRKDFSLTLTMLNEADKLAKLAELKADPQTVIDATAAFWLKASVEMNFILGTQEQIKGKGFQHFTAEVAL